MSSFDPQLFLSMLAMIGAVIIVSALFSSVVERTGVPQVLVFLAIGALIGPAGLGWLDAGVQSPILRVVATLSLTLVLFTDALSLNLKEVRAHKQLAALVVGPGTILSGALIAWLAWMLLGLSPALAAILGASLSSTDPVLLRSFIRQPLVPESVRQALRLESGMNDAILLPVVLVGITLLTSGEMTGSEWGSLAMHVLLLSPLIGVLVAWVSIRALERIRRKVGVIRRDYESLYSLGVAFMTFALAEAIHGSGFLAAFAAGITIAAIDVELCDCFLEYGETTAEMALLFTFVLFGTSIIWTGLSAVTVPLAIFTGLVFLARPLVFIPALLPAKTSWRNRALIAWFGPRGLSSLLLVLLAVFANTPGATPLVSICSLVVLCSVILHGFSPALLLRGEERKEEKTPAEERGQPAGTEAEPEYITIEEYKEALERGEPVVVLDVRTERSRDLDELMPEGSVRISPDSAVADARRLKVAEDKILAALCA